jgi:hypothetical protein
MSRLVRLVHTQYIARPFHPDITKSSVTPQLMRFQGLCALTQKIQGREPCAQVPSALELANNARLRQPVDSLPQLARQPAQWLSVVGSVRAAAVQLHPGIFCCCSTAPCKVPTVAGRGDSFSSRRLCVLLQVVCSACSCVMRTNRR